MSGVTDLEVYQRFTAMAEELAALSARGPTLVGRAALDTAIQTLRGIALAVYQQSFDQTEHNAQ